jgi:Transcriptional regulators
MKQIAVALHMSLNTFHRLDLALGIVQYAREQSNWRIYGNFYTANPVPDYRAWSGDGIISICHSSEEAEEILATGLPVVDVVQGFVDERMVYVTGDNIEAGRRAGDHLLSIGFDRFAFCHAANVHWSHLRGKGFAEAVGADLNDIPCFERGLGWWQGHARPRSLENFLLSLPPKTAVLAANDTIGGKVTTACQNCGLKVPDDIAVIGVDGNDLQCELSYPALSTIPIDGPRIGYEAAGRLDDLIHKKGRASRQPMFVPPKRVVLRASSDTFVCEDESVRRALMFIRQNFRKKLSVAIVAREAAVCRRTLELRFRRYLNRTILEEIQANRMRHAIHLLEDSNLPVSSIYLRSGFVTHQIFYGMFKKMYGVTPLQYREKYKAVHHTA